MLGALRVPKDGNAQPLVKFVIRPIAIARREPLRICRLGVQEEDVGAGEFGEDVDMFENVCFDRILGLINDQVGINIDNGTPLSCDQHAYSDRIDSRNPYQSNGCLVQDLCPHLMHRLCISGHTDIGD